MNTVRGGRSGGAVRRLSPARVWRMFRRIALWLDARGLRAYPQDMHSWSGKMETLRALKTAAPQPAPVRDRGGPIPRLGGSEHASGRRPFHQGVAFEAVS